MVKIEVDERVIELNQGCADYKIDKSDAYENWVLWSNVLVGKYPSCAVSPFYRLDLLNGETSD